LHSVWQSIILPLIPGAVRTALCLAIAPAIQAGHAALMALLLSLITHVLLNTVGMKFPLALALRQIP